jgi:histidyl-tRNA synthetase
LRSKNIRCELYHETVKFDKQFKYAEKKNIPWVVIIGSKELENQNCVIKDLASGKQETVSYEQLLQHHF